MDAGDEKRPLCGEGSAALVALAGRPGLRCFIPGHEDNTGLRRTKWTLYLVSGYFSSMRKIPVTTGLSFLPSVLANALMVSSVPRTMIGARYTGELFTG